MDACTIWEGRIDRHGYGRLGAHLAHRVTYEREVGPIPDGMELDHLCRVRACVNPSHLEPVTKRENQIRGVGFVAINAAKTHCASGHAFDVANTYVKPNGRRQCRACNRGQAQRYRRAA